MAEIYFIAKFVDNSVAHIALQTEIRTNGRTITTQWSDAEVFAEVERYAQHWAKEGMVVASWRRISQDEHLLFEKDREYRDAMEETPNGIGHNMPKARLLHQAKLRHWNGDRFMTLDREWVDAFASGDKQKADGVEAKRKMLRDFVNDPRIATAQTIEELKQILPPEI